MVWIKSRSTTDSNSLFDTVRGATKILYSDLTNSESTESSSVTAFNSSGFNLGATIQTNRSGAAFTSWTFRKAPKFFDVVTWTGDGTTSGRKINHSLGITPGMIIVKRTDTASNWMVAHCAYGWFGAKAGYDGTLNSSAAFTGWYWWPDGVPPTSTQFPVSNFSSPSLGTNLSVATYVAYLFAHDTASDGRIYCGSFTTDGSGNASVTAPGWEPQFLLAKAATTTGDWIMLDTMRGWDLSANDAKLLANTTSSESTTTEYGNPTATGFDFKGGAASQTYVYMAIRRPNKPPTSGSEVFNLGTGTAISRKMPTGYKVVDSFWGRLDRTNAYTPKWMVTDRLRGMKPSSGALPSLETTSTAVESVPGAYPYMDGYNTDLLAWQGSAVSVVNYTFSRAPGFFDVVCYTGTGADIPQGHNLGVVPELIVTKQRNSTGNWRVSAYPLLSISQVAYLDANAGFGANSTEFYRAPTSTQLSPRDSGNTLSQAYVSYLFASLPGVSKVGSYTGNGSSQTINCGFSTGARFILIKRTDSTGDWYIWDSARGIVAANDPHLSLNTTAAEVTTDDSVDPDNSGFIVNQNTATNININAVTYIFLAIA